MENNLLLEQYSRYKKMSLEESPYSCLLNTDIEINPHQINAFCAAIQTLKTGGIILADEVGLGKTIEAGLVLKYVIEAGGKKILIALPAMLRKQWEIELDEKFGIKSIILDRLTVEKDYHSMKDWLEKENQVRVIITSYDYASKFINRFPEIKLDFIIIDEAHNLRNVFHGTKRAKNIYDLTKGIPKILLTATPLQNSLNDLHGLVSFIDPRIFGSEKIFNKRYVEGRDYNELKKIMQPILYRTLRKDVGKYMDFKKRTCLTVDFTLTQVEKTLYEAVNEFLKRKTLYSIPVNNKGLVILVIRKVLASSSFAVVETFEVFKHRLEKLYQGTKSAKAQEGFDLFWDFVEDEIDESEFEEVDDAHIAEQKKEIEDELAIVDSILELANSIHVNAKVQALQLALEAAFDQQKSLGIAQKAVVFTESKRTQKYIAAELRKNGYKEEDIILFNGDFNDPMTKEIYRAWQVKNYEEINYGRNVEYKHAIVDYFKNNAKILIATDIGSEGLNLQFCNTVINYDLPWNPQKIEQRIGRCHRYGQKHDVVAINLLNTENEADKRVYEILSRKFELFEGVFGASDVALGALESGTSFEKKVLEIYQKCNSDIEFNKEFDKLNNQLDSKINEQISQLQSLLLAESTESKGKSLGKTKETIANYLEEVKYWSQFAEPEMDGQLYYWEIDNWGEEYFGSHGTLFLGAFCNNTQILFPVLLLCDEHGEYIDFEESEIVGALENAKDEEVKFFKPTDEDMEYLTKVYDRLQKEMIDRYNISTASIKKYNQHKIENWVSIQVEQLTLKIKELQEEVQNYLFQETLATDSLEKYDIRKKASLKKKQLDKLEKGLKKAINGIDVEAERSISEFNKQFEINPILLVNIVLKF